MVYNVASCLECRKKFVAYPWRVKEFGGFCSSLCLDNSRLIYKKRRKYFDRSKG